MIKVHNDDLIINHKAYLNAYKNSSSATFLQDGFLGKAYPVLQRMQQLTYPYEVKLPKSMNALREGDFTPSKTFVIEKPIEGLYSPMWFGNSSDGCALRCGYINGDSRYICDKVLGDADVHMVLGGATGQGKSVTLNSIIFGMCTEYAPWELCLTLCDAKIVEFKSYALQTPMPHIKSIAATGDSDYLISVLEDLYVEMNMFNNILVEGGIKNIKDFREKTGLAMPQNIIVIDEFQTMFKKAGKKMNRLLQLIEFFAKLGRNTGYHLLLASQELGSEISSETLANIKLRAAMGCTSAISTKILGNDEAKENYGKKGRLIFNANADNHLKSENVHVRVPYMPDSQRLDLGANIIEKAKEFGFERLMSFYDENATIKEADYTKFLKTFSIDRNRILLGEPAFVLKDKEQVVQMRLTGKEIENVCVLVNNNAHLERYFKMLKSNMLLHGNQLQHVVLVVDRLYSEECNAKELVHTPSFYSESKSFNNNYIIDVAIKLVYRRKLALDVDDRVFTGAPYNSSCDEMFYERFGKGSSFDTDINKRRFFFAMSLLENDEIYRSAFGLSTAKDIRAEQIKYAERTVEMFTDYNCASCKLEFTNFPPIFAWLLGINKLIGLGRDKKNANVVRLKKALQDCSDVAVRFMIFTTTLEDMDELRDGIRWFIMDDTPQKEISRVKASDDYPDQVSPILGVLFDSGASKDKCVKFKKMVLEGELL